MKAKGRITMLRRYMMAVAVMRPNKTKALTKKHQATTPIKVTI